MTAEDLYREHIAEATSAFLGNLMDSGSAIPPGWSFEPYCNAVAAEAVRIYRANHQVPSLAVCIPLARDNVDARSAPDLTP